MKSLRQTSGSGRSIGVTAVVLALAWAAAFAQQSVILDMETVRHRPGEFTNKEKQKVPVGTVELVEGKVGKACRFSFAEGAKPQLMSAGARGSAEWDRAAGFSFWVKGDGSASWGGIELIDNSDYALRYGYCFPVDSTEWRKVVVPWRDLTPELAGPLVNAQGGYAPSRFGNFWFGKWHYWRDYPAHSYTIDQVALETEIPADGADYTPREAGTPRFLAKLQQKQPVTIVTMGDSLTDTRHWANRPKLWADELAKALKAKYGGEVTLVNPAMGGTTLNQNVILMPRWLKGTPKPDLVTICFGFNDWDSNVRGQRFAEYLRAGIDRIRRETQGQTEILLLTTCPAHGRWRTMDEMAGAVRAVAREKKTGLADIAAAFHATGAPDALLQQGYWVWDKTHLGPKGHDLVRDVVLKAVETPGIPATPTDEPAGPAPAEQVASAAAGTLLSGFEGGDPFAVAVVGGTVVEEHATQGKRALRLDRDPAKFVSLSIQDGRALRQVRDHTRILIDVFNPQDHAILIGIRVDDMRTTDYNTRFNDDSFKVEPGKSTIDLDYSQIVLSGSRNKTPPDLIDPTNVRFLMLMLHPGNQAETLFVDNLRLARGKRAAAPPAAAAP